MARLTSLAPAPHRLGYLSAAPTVSTRPDAASAGPRAHILGVVNGFRALGWEVRPWIAGDRLPPGSLASPFIAAPCPAGARTSRRTCCATS